MIYRTSRAFTLIETTIYLAVYAIILTGAIVSVYAIFGSSARNQARSFTQQEGSFLIGKIDWALTGADKINQPNDGLSQTTDRWNTLSVSKFDTSVGDPIVIFVTGGLMKISRGGNPSVTIHNSNTTVTCPSAGCFTHISPSGDGINPESIKAEFTIHATTSEGLAFSQDFMTIKYLRK